MKQAGANLKTKLLIMAPQFYPQKNGGGPPVSILNVINSIKNSNKFHIFVISKNYELHETAPLAGVASGWNDLGFGRVYYFDHSLRSMPGVYRLIKSVKPDVIYQNSFFSYDDVLPVLCYKKMFKNTKVIIAPRCELSANTMRRGALKKSVYIKCLKTMGLLEDVHFHATGVDEAEDIQKLLNIKESHLHNIQNISLIQNKNFVEIKKSPGSLRIMFAGRVQFKKNLLSAIKFLRGQTAEIIYDIYGPMEDSVYWRACEAEILKLPRNVTVNYRGVLAHEEVSDKIKEYHVFFMPTLAENHGHSIVEALLSCRPVMISDQTPWSDVAAHNAGYAIPLNRPSEFEKAIKKYADMDNDEFQKTSHDANTYINTQLSG